MRIFTKKIQPGHHDAKIFSILPQLLFQKEQSDSINLTISAKEMYEYETAYQFPGRTPDHPWNSPVRRFCTRQFQSHLYLLRSSADGHLVDH